MNARACTALPHDPTSALLSRQNFEDAILSSCCHRELSFVIIREKNSDKKPEGATGNICSGDTQLEVGKRVHVRAVAPLCAL